jgi:hypothetical protein
LYNPDNFLKNNIFMTGNSRPTLNQDGYIMKRSIVGSIECFEKLLKQNKHEVNTQSSMLKGGSKTRETTKSKGTK